MLRGSRAAMKSLEMTVSKMTLKKLWWQQQGSHKVFEHFSGAIHSSKCFACTNSYNNIIANLKRSEKNLKKMDICVCITDSIFYTPKTNTILYINYPPIKLKYQNK